MSPGVHEREAVTITRNRKYFSPLEPSPAWWLYLCTRSQKQGGRWGGRGEWLKQTLPSDRIL